MTIATIISNPKGIVHPPVASCKAPTRTGPVAASKYPNDCAIPDISAASFPSFVRKVKNIIDKLNALPPATPSKIAAIGILVAVLHQVLVRAGREDQAMMTTLAGLVIVLTLVIKEISTLFDSVRTMFGL